MLTAPPVADRAPGPQGRFLVGCLAEFRHDPISLLLRATSQYGNLVRMKIGPVLVHLINHPRYIEHVLVRNSSNYDKHTRSVAKIRATCGQSLLSTDGGVWQRHRRLIQPAFQPDSVERFLDVIVAATQQMLQRWSEAARCSQPLDVVAEMTKVTLTIAARSLFGAEIEPHTNEVVSSLEVILADTWRRLQNWVDATSIHSALHRSAFKDARRSIDGIVFDIIRGRRKQVSEPDDLLSILIRAHDKVDGTSLSDQELRDACVSLLLAGHETTANALAWSCFLVGTNPAVEQRLRSEARSVLGDKGTTSTDTEMLAFAEQTFAETIRLYPSIWIMERRVVVEDRIDGYRIPAGSTLLISPYLLHRHLSFWPNADRFDPDRFAASAVRARPHYTYLPFGAGPHQCIGRHMACLVGRVVLAMVFRQFHLQVLSQPCAPEPGITLRHGAPLPMRIQVLES